VILLASQTDDPREVLTADDAGDRPDSDFRSDAFGFYWTEGLKGLGWARDTIPTLKGGSTVGIPSTPGVWLPKAEPGRKLLMPTIENCEELQGFPRGWTTAADLGRRNGPRWKLTGNAVTVGVAAWIGERSASPDTMVAPSVRLDSGVPWPTAAWGGRDGAWRVKISEYPRHEPYVHFRDLLDEEGARAISNRGATGFYGRTLAGKLRFDSAFIEDVIEHIEVPPSWRAFSLEPTAASNTIGRLPFAFRGRSTPGRI
jgi:DNA (cytosine-5)-methyltransferase 1